MAADQAIGSVRVQFQDPVANDLHRYARYCCSFDMRGPVTKSCEGHQSRGLPCTLAAPGDAAKARGGVLVRKRDAHGGLIEARAGEPDHCYVGKALWVTPDGCRCEYIA